MSAELDKAIEIIAGHVIGINDNGTPVFDPARVYDVIKDDYLSGQFQIARQHGLGEPEFAKRVCEAFAKRVAA